MNAAAWVVGIYGLVSVVGGLVGYVKAKSRASLIAGSIAGLLLFSCAYGISLGSSVGATGSLLVAFLLGGRFLGTWRRTHRLMPDLMMVVLGGLTLATVSLALLQRAHR